MQAIVHAADVQDRDGGVLLMKALSGLYPFLLKLYADSGYQGAKFQDGLKAVCAQVSVEIVRRCDVSLFVVLPRRWVVERTIGWLNRCRRLAKDWEGLSRNALAFLRWASVRLMVSGAKLWAGGILGIPPTRRSTIRSGHVPFQRSRAASAGRTRSSGGQTARRGC